MTNTCEDARHGGVVVFNGEDCPACAAIASLESDNLDLLTQLEESDWADIGDK